MYTGGRPDLSLHVRLFSLGTRAQYCKKEHWVPSFMFYGTSCINGNSPPSSPGIRESTVAVRARERERVVEREDGCLGLST